MKYFSFTALLVLPLFLQAQYKYDNVLYKTVAPQKLCRELKNNPGYLLLDVRSPGEYSDTSASTGLNIGHLNTAMNIDIRQVGQRLNEIASYKDKPVFVYCSHSQRSRRVSKMLADSGFTHVNNINGGMTALRQLGETHRDCVDSLIVSNNSYAIISPAGLCKKLSTRGNNILLLDVRSDSVWDHVSSNARFNAYGYLKGTKHMALDALPAQLSSLPRDKEIIITDINGADAAKAARLLKESGFHKVAVLLEGMDRWLYSDRSGWACVKDLYVPAVAYTIISSPEFGRFQSANKNYLALDVRTAEEFDNRHKESFRNIGHLKNAIHIPAAGLTSRLAEIDNYKNKPVVVYAFSGSPEAYAAANILTQNGFKNVKVLVGGLFNIRWTAANEEGMQYLHGLVVNVPEENK